MDDKLKHIESLINDITLLKGQKQALEQERKVTYIKVKEAKEWLLKLPEREAFLKEMQHFIHKNDIGKFSEILTSLVQEVLQKESKAITLNLDVQRNLPALKIEALNGSNGEDIYSGSGGSIVNIVATGLRLIALHRMGQRRFIILDEPDCWLETKHVPTFANTIGQLSSILKIQTIIISHHPYQFFKDYGRVIELKKNNNQLYAEIIHDTPVEDGDNKDIIKSITMRRFMSHYDTTYMLHPHLTCIIGTNDIGKSVVSAAMKAVAYNESSDNYIMHHENEAQVIIDFMDDYSILWQRFKTTNSENPQKVKYSLLKNNIPVVDPEYNARETPKFITKKLNIIAIDDIDIHIGNQKDPAFLLSPNIKPSQKAKILSLGQDAVYMQKMLEQLKTLSREKRLIEKEGDLKYIALEEQLSLLSNIEEHLIKAEQLKLIFKETFQQQVENDKLKLFLENLNKISKQAKIAPIPIENKLNTTLKFKNFTELSSLSKKIMLYQTLSQLVKVDNNIADMNLKDFQGIKKVSIAIKKFYTISLFSKINIEHNDNLDFHKNVSYLQNLNDFQYKLSKLNYVSHLKKININNFQDYHLINNQQHIETANTLTAQNEHMKSEYNKGKKLKIEYEDIQQQISLIKVCPLCNQHIEHTHTK